MGAPALAVERDRRVERRSRVRCEKRCQLALAAVELLRESARADEQPDLGPVRPQRDQHDRAQPQAGELGHVRRARVEQLEHGRGVDARPERVERRRGTAARGRAPAALHSVDSSELAALVEEQQLARLDGRTRPSERTATSAIARRVAQRAHVDEQARERRQIDACVIARSSSIGSAPEPSIERSDAAALAAGREAWPSRC